MLLVNRDIKVGNKYLLMKDIGVNNYMLNEEIKFIFDPNFMLNPHLSIKKPESFHLKAIKRSDKIRNWLFTKLKI